MAWDGRCSTTRWSNASRRGSAARRLRYRRSRSASHRWPSASPTRCALGSPEIVSPALSAPLPPTEERLLEVTEHVIDDAIARGPVVLVGRGAQSYLAQRTDALHVFCYASRPALIARVVQREGIAADEAAKRVDETNKRREQYVRRYWQRSWHAPENYHLCVNTEWLGIDGAADLIVQVARERLA